MSLDLFVRGLRTAVARHPGFSWAFLYTNEHAGQLLVGPNALWPTQPKFWVGVAHRGVAH